MKAMTVQLTDGIGNRCRADLYKYGTVDWEVYFQEFNGSVPTRYIGTLEQCNQRIALWTEVKREQGFNV